MVLDRWILYSSPRHIHIVDGRGKCTGGLGEGTCQMIGYCFTFILLSLRSIVCQMTEGSYIDTKPHSLKTDLVVSGN